MFIDQKKAADLYPGDGLCEGPQYLVDRLYQMGEKLCFFGEHQYVGDVPAVSIEDRGRIASFSNFCWCDRDDGSCLHCLYRLEEADVSAHEFLSLKPRLEKAGYVQGHGAPLIHFHDPSAGIRLRVWFYKHLGRSTEYILDGTEELDIALQALEDFLKEQQAQAISWSARRALDRLFAFTRGEAHPAQQSLETVLDMLERSGGDTEAVMKPLLDSFGKSLDCWHELKNIEREFDRYSSLPRKNRDGEKLPLSWRIKTHLKNASGGTGKKNGRRRP